MLLETLYQPLTKARSTNQTGGFPARVPQAATPATAAATATSQAIFPNGMGQGNFVGGISQNKLRLYPFATASNNVTASMRVYGWYVIDFGKTTQEWNPIILIEVDFVVSSAVPRVAVATEMFADTITIVGTTGSATRSSEIVSPADDVTIGHVITELKGCAFWEAVFKMGTATGANALFGLM